MEIDNCKEVYFWKYCKLCEYRFNCENERPCDICLTISSRKNSHKPFYFKEKTYSHKKSFL